MSGLQLVRFIDSYDDVPEKWGDEGVDTFIQWKGTQVCMDWLCPICGQQHHTDGEFCYFLHCHSCGNYLHVGQNVKLTPATERWATEGASCGCTACWDDD